MENCFSNCSTVLQTEYHFSVVFLHCHIVAVIYLSFDMYIEQVVTIYN